jgi:hypothetical protein
LSLAVAEFRGGTKPSLGSLPIRRQIVTSRKQRAETSRPSIGAIPIKVVRKNNDLLLLLQ